MRLAHVLGGDALAHRGERSLGLHWSAAGDRFFTLTLCPDLDALCIFEFDATSGAWLGHEALDERDALAFAMAPDRQHWIVLHESGTSFHSLADGTNVELPSLFERYQYKRAAAFAPDQSFAVYATHPNALWLMRTSDPSTAERIDDGLAVFAISWDSQRIAYATAKNTVVVMRADNGRIEATAALDDASSPLSLLRWSIDGRSLLGAHANGTVVRWDFNGTLSRRWRLAQPRRPRALGIDLEASRAWVSVESSRELALDWNTGQQLADRRLKVDPDIRTLDLYSPNGARAVSPWHTQLELIDTRTCEPLDLHDGHSGAITSIRVAPDGSQFATTSEDGTVRAWSAKDSSLLWVLGEVDGRRPIAAAEYSVDGRSLFTRGSYNDVREWDPVTGTEVPSSGPTYASLRLPKYDYPYTFMLSWFGLIAGTRDFALSGPASSSDYSSPNASWCTLRWSSVDGRVLWSHNDNESRQSKFQLSPDGRFLVQLRPDGTLRVFAADTGAILTPAATAARKVRAMSFSPDGSLVLLHSKGVSIFSDATASERSVHSAGDRTGPMAIAPSGDVMACIDSLGSVALVSLENGSLIDSIALEKAHDACRALAWTDGGNTLIVATERRLLLLFERT